MSKNKYASVRAGSSTNNGQGQSFAPIILGVNKGDKVIYVTVKNISVFTDKSGTDCLLLAGNPGIKTLGKLDYIRAQEGFRKPILKIVNEKKFGSTLSDRDLEAYKG